MNPADRIPFSQKDESQIRSLTNWMGAVGVVHFVGSLGFGLFGAFSLLGAAALFGVSALAGAVSVLYGLGVLALSLLMIVEGGLILMARSKFVGSIEDTSSARPLVAAGLRLLKFLFLCELVWLGGSGLLSLLDVTLFFALPEQPETGEQVADLIRRFGGNQ